MLGYSMLNLTDSTISDCYASIYGGAIYSSSIEKLSIDSAKLLRNKAGEQYGAEVYVNDAHKGTIIANSVTEDVETATAFYVLSSSIEMDNVKMSGFAGMASRGAGLWCIDCHPMKLNALNVKGGMASIGGCIYLEQT